LGTIAEAADRDGLEAPVVTVIGAVAAFGENPLLIPNEVRDPPDRSRVSAG
jgi:hypothetical protein